MVCSPHQYQLGRIANGFYTQSAPRYEPIFNQPSNYLKSSLYQFNPATQAQPTYLSISRTQEEYNLNPQSTAEFAFLETNPSLTNLFRSLPKIKFSLPQNQPESKQYSYSNEKPQEKTQLSFQTYIPLENCITYQTQTKEHLRDSLAQKIQRELLDLKQLQQPQSLQYVYN